MLSFTEFQEQVTEEIKNHLPEQYANADVVINTVTKNNGMKLQALSVRPEGKVVTPNIYLEGFYEKYQGGADLDEVVGNIAKVTSDHMEGPEFAENIAADFMNFEFIKDRVIMTVVNTEKNREMLEHTPHTEKEDLSFIYKVLVGDPEEDGMATITIKDEHMKYWDATVEDLHQYAVKNSQEKLPAKLQTMNEIMRDMLGRDGVPEEVIDSMMDSMPPENQMYVISNSNSVNGATAIFYSDVLDELSKKLGGKDLYILPSSVHEVIAISQDMGTPEMLANMVQEVNGNEVSPEEQLSDHVYKYDAKSKDITLADTTIEELKKNQKDTEVQDASRPRRHR